MRGSFAKGEQTTLNQKDESSVSYVRTQFGIFFERVMELYNLTFFKEAKDHKVEDVKRFVNELYEAGCIGDYIKETIDDTITKFTSLLPGQTKKTDINLDSLESLISIRISEVNSEIKELAR